MSKRNGDPGYAPNWCIHFRDASRNDTCEAGVDYEAWRGTPFQKRPCFLDDGNSRPGAVHCPKLRRPTPEEIALNNQHEETIFRRMAAVMVGIGDWRRAHKGKSAAEVVECPACHGRLHLSIAASNGHVHGACETEGCVRWIE